MIVAQFCVVPATCGFEVTTHAALTSAAWDRAKFDDPLLLTRLGILDSKDAFEDIQYFDLKNGVVRYREALVFERTQMPPGSTQFSIAGWLMRGAIREDDDSDMTDPSPKGDAPDGDIHRVFRHFFDPLNNAPLTSNGFNLCGIGVACAKAVDWAIGTTDYRVTPVLADTNRGNHFSVFDAREAMFRALTGHDANYVLVGDGAGLRNSYWATMFRALGDVLHLNQDMAQPQHTRNDAHTGVGWSLFQSSFSGHKSTFEVFVDSSIRQFPVLVVGADRVQLAPSVFDLDGYPTPTFANYSDYWTGPGFGGLADYSNRGFFTAGKNLGDLFNTYPTPVSNPDAYTEVLTDAKRWDGTPVPGSSAKTIFLLGPVHDDSLSITDSGVRMTARSSWDQFLRPLGKSAYTLMRENYIDQAKLLLPRAVGYSAGLLDYFFRGRLKIELPPEEVYAVKDFSTYSQPNAGFTTFKVMVQNVTAPITPPGGGAAQAQGTSTDGKLVAILRYRQNTCLKLTADEAGASLTGSPYRNPDGSGNAIWSETCRQPTLADQAMPDILESNRVDLDVVAPDGIDAALKPVVFTFPTALPFNAVDVDLQVIYRGPLGTESDGIAVGFEHINEPTFFNFDNNNDCFTDAGDKQCPIGTADATCNFSDSVKLPFPEALDAPGWSKVVSISDLKPGQYARVAFLTRSAFREQPPADLEVVTNENFPYEVTVTYIPDGDTVFWPPGPTIKSPLKLSRPLGDQTASVKMLEWYGHGTYKTACANGYCDQYGWASSCQPIYPTPQPVQVNFP